jgi:chromate reductase, NAD(P)H dehydrogenase (quinone)
MTQTARPPLRILVFGASLRVASLNDRLATLAAKTIEDHGATVDRAHMRDFETPSYDGDAQAADGFPAGAAALRERLLAADGFVLASPEYNFSFPGVLKNSIDWVSRYRPQPFKGKHGLLMSASASMAGGNRGLWALRVPLEHLGATLHPDMFSLAQAHLAFDEVGRIADPALQEWFEGNLAAFLDTVEAVVHYPCAKTAWVEFLGEHDDPATHRVETS